MGFLIALTVVGLLGGAAFLVLWGALKESDIATVRSRRYDEPRFAVEVLLDDVRHAQRSILLVGNDCRLDEADPVLRKKLTDELLSKVGRGIRVTLVFAKLPETFAPLIGTAAEIRVPRGPLPYVGRVIDDELVERLEPSTARYHQQPPVSLRAVSPDSARELRVLAEAA